MLRRITMIKRLFLAMLILTLVLMVSAVSFAGNITDEKKEKLNTVEIIKPELGSLKSIVVQDSLAIQIKVPDHAERYINLIKVESIFLEHQEEKIEEAEEAKAAETKELPIIGDDVIMTESSLDDIDNEHESDVIAASLITPAIVTEESPVLETVQVVELSEKELYNNLMESKKAFDDKRAEKEVLEKKAETLKITFTSNEPTNIKETNAEEIQLMLEYKDLLDTYKVLEEKFELDLQAYKKFFDVYVIEAKEIVLDGLLMNYNDTVDNILEGDYRLEVVNSESGVIEAKLEFEIKSKESLEKELIKKEEGNTLVKDLLKINTDNKE